MSSQIFPVRNVPSGLVGTNFLARHVPSVSRLRENECPVSRHRSKRSDFYVPSGERHHYDRIYVPSGGRPPPFRPPWQLLHATTAIRRGSSSSTGPHSGCEHYNLSRCSPWLHHLRMVKNTAEDWRLLYCRHQGPSLRAQPPSFIKKFHSIGQPPPQPRSPGPPASPTVLTICVWSRLRHSTWIAEQEQSAKVNSFVVIRVIVKTSKKSIQIQSSCHHSRGLRAYPPALCPETCESHQPPFRES